MSLLEADPNLLLMSFATLGVRRCFFVSRPSLVTKTDSSVIEAGFLVKRGLPRVITSDGGRAFHPGVIRSSDGTVGAPDEKEGPDRVLTWRAVGA